MRRLITVSLVLLLACAIGASIADAKDKGGGGGKKGPKTPPTPEQIFATMDTNNDNTVTQEEYLAAQKHGKKYDEAKAKVTFAKMGGSAAKGISLEDFKNYLEQKKQKHEGKKGGKKN